ncbi:MAG: DJ-1/PfpI family protein [Candidatus Omnitrophota bacterium]
MTKKAVIVLANGFEEIESVTVIDILRRAGVKIIIAGLGGKKITGSHGLVIETDTIFNEKEQDFDACILPGGGLGATNLAASKEVSAFIKQMNVQDKIIAAICASPAVVLAPTGILEKKIRNLLSGF